MSRTDKADWKIVWIFCGMLAVCSLLMMRIYLLSMSSGLQRAAAEQSRALADGHHNTRQDL